MTGQRNDIIDDNQRKMAVPCPLLCLFHLHRYPMDGNLHGTQRSSGKGSA